MKSTLAALLLATLWHSSARAATVGDVRAQCSALDGTSDGNDTLTARMHGASCYVMLNAWAYRDFYEMLALCTHMPALVDGHLPWVR